MHDPQTKFRKGAWGTWFMQWTPFSCTLGTGQACLVFCRLAGTNALGCLPCHNSWLRRAGHPEQRKVEKDFPWLWAAHSPQTACHFEH